MRAGKAKTLARHWAVMAAVTASLCLPSWALGQHAGVRRAAPAPRAQQVRPPQGRSNQGKQGRPNGGPAVQRPNGVATRPAMPNGANGAPVRPNAGAYGAGPVRPAFQGNPYAGQAAPRSGPGAAVRPAYPTTAYAPPGHLGSWLNERRNVPVQEQEKQIRNDPSFRRLPPGEQQRLVQQLHGLNSMSEDQRQRRLARAENLEHLSPEDRMRVNKSARDWATLPADRQMAMRNAFRDLRSVPPDQRGIVLNSARYRGQFSPQERGILTDELRVEPYEAPR